MKDFTSFSIEYNNLPFYAGARLSNLTSQDVSVSPLINKIGNHSQPNKFSINLLSNLGCMTGLMPVIRLSGSTQYVPKFSF